MANNRTPKRHVYLPGLSAFDSSHQKAAAFELSQGANSPTPNHQAGSVFFDTVEAKREAKLAFSQRAYDIRKKLARGGHSANAAAKLQRELDGMTHAVRNSHVIDTTRVNPGLPHHDQGLSDVLYVKGHGNSNNHDHISTRTTTASGTAPMQAGQLNFTKDTDITIKRGHRARHSAHDIAKSVKHINAMTESPGLDVRITSCGSGGGVSSGDPHGDVYRYYNSFAGSVSQELDDMHANREIVVSGYIGDSNSSHPRTQVSDGFVSQLKQRGDDPTFQQRRQNFTRRIGLGVNATDSQKLKETRSADQGIIGGMEANVQAPPEPPVSNALQGRMQAYSKVTTTDDEMINVTAVPRSSARIQFPRR